MPISALRNHNLKGGIKKREQTNGVEGRHLSRLTLSAPLPFSYNTPQIEENKALIYHVILAD